MTDRNPEIYDKPSASDAARPRHDHAERREHGERNGRERAERRDNGERDARERTERRDNGERDGRERSERRENGERDGRERTERRENGERDARERTERRENGERDAHERAERRENGERDARERDVRRENGERRDNRERNGHRSSAWDAPDEDRFAGFVPGLKSVFTGSRLKTTLLVVLLSLCMLTNTVYSGARAVFGRMNIVEAAPTETVTVTPPPEQLQEINEMGEDEFDTSNLIISDKDVEIILLVGADFDVDDRGSRSDTIMLVAIDRVHQKTKIISIMRDLYAPIAGTKGSNKINYAYYYDSSMGNTDLKCTRATIEKCFGIVIDHFAVINFDMFVVFIEALGEIEVEMNAAEAKYMDDNGRWLQPRYMGSREAGVYYLNGKESLYFVRMRKTGNGDYERTERQRRFLGLVLDKAKSMSYAQMVKALTTILPYITTDLSENQIFGYCFDAPRLLKYEIVQFRLPVDGAHKMGWATIGTTNVSILITNYTFLAEVTQNFIYNDDMTYTFEGARASGVALPAVTTISFETATEASETEAQTTTPAPASETEPPPDTTTSEATSAPDTDATSDTPSDTP